MTQPTPAAMRAAKAIAECLDEPTAEEALHDMAHRIDVATGLPELIAALQVTMCHWCGDCYGSNPLYHAPCRFCRGHRELLEKVTKEEK